MRMSEYLNRCKERDLKKYQEDDEEEKAWILKYETAVCRASGEARRKPLTEEEYLKYLNTPYPDFNA